MDGRVKPGHDDVDGSMPATAGIIRRSPTIAAGYAGACDRAAPCADPLGSHALLPHITRVTPVAALDVFGRASLIAGLARAAA